MLVQVTSSRLCNLHHKLVDERGYLTSVQVLPPSFERHTLASKPTA
jgi:hypothetical protein